MAIEINGRSPVKGTPAVFIFRRRGYADMITELPDYGGIDMNIVELTNKNFLRLNDSRVMAQMEARNEYVNFHETTGNLMTKAL